MKRDPDKLRDWQRRSKPLKRGPGPQRTGYIRSRNPERRAKMFERNFGERSHAVRAMDCLCAGKLDRPLQMKREITHEVYSQVAGRKIVQAKKTP